MSKAKFTSIGGQALIEGVMMRNGAKIGLCVRQPDEEIYKEDIEIKPVSDKYKILKWPLLRGVSGFISSMKLGYKTLMISAQKSGLDLDDAEPETKFEKWLMDKFGDKLMTVVSSIGMVLGVALSFGLFFFLPSLLRNGSLHLIKLISGHEMADTARSLYTSIFEGIIKIVIFVIYLFLVSKMKEMRRVFEYHGAEHKTIFCYESGQPLTVENVKSKKRFHPRCGTSFLVLMMFVGMIISFTIARFTSANENVYLWTAIKILTVPVIMGLGYEVLKLAGKYDNIFTRIISAPGMWVQRLTTKEPDDSQIEVAIASLVMVLSDEDKERLGIPLEEPEVEETKEIEVASDENVDTYMETEQSLKENASAEGNDDT